HDLAYVAGFALDAVAQQHGLHAHGFGYAGGGLQGQLGRGHQVGRDARQARIIGLDGFAGAGLQQAAGGVGNVDAVPADDFQGLLAGGRIGHGGAGGDVHGVVAGHVGDQQVQHSGGSAGGGQPAAFDGGQVAAHAVHFADRRAGFQQGFVDGLLVGQGDAFAGQRQQGGSAARDQADHQVVFAQVADRAQDLV